MNKKFKKNGGFTLVEMLIVVAIIAILIAISIPLVSSSLEKSRHAVDDANRRDAISLATVYYLTHQDDKDITWGTANEYTYGVLNSQGVLMKGGAAVQADDPDDAGSTTAGTPEPVTKQCTCKDRTYGDNNLTITIASDGSVTTSWDSACNTGSSSSSTTPKQ